MRSLFCHTIFGNTIFIHVTRIVDGQAWSAFRMHNTLLLHVLFFLQFKMRFISVRFWAIHIKIGDMHARGPDKIASIWVLSKNLQRNKRGSGINKRCNLNNSWKSQSRTPVLRTHVINNKTYNKYIYARIRAYMRACSSCWNEFSTLWYYSLLEICIFNYASIMTQRRSVRSYCQLTNPFGIDLT